MKRIVVFGATGNLGANICLHLKDKYQVIAVGRRKSDNGFFADYGMTYHSVDIGRKEDFEKLPHDNIYAVLNFAGALPASMKGYDPELYISSVITGTLNVLEYTRKVKADRIVFPQSLFDISYLFGTKVPIPADSVRKAPYDGDHAMYVIAKNAAVDMIENYHSLYGLKRFIIRLSRIYSYDPNPYTFTDGEKVMVSDRYLIYQAMKGKDLEIWGEPDRLLETIHVYDFLQIVEKSLDADHDGGIYNAASGGSTIEERIRGIMEVFNPNPDARIVYRPEKPSASQFVLDYLKTVNELGYKPKYTWKDYLTYMKEEMKEQRFEKLWGKESDYYQL